MKRHYTKVGPSGPYDDMEPLYRTITAQGVVEVERNGERGFVAETSDARRGFGRTRDLAVEDALSQPIPNHGGN